MAGYQRCITLALAFFLLCHDSLALESTACKDHNLVEEVGRQYMEFKRKHLMIHPDGVEFNEKWKTFVKDPRYDGTRTLLQEADAMAVCGNEGRKYTGVNGDTENGGKTNLCISKKPFEMYTLVKIKGDGQYSIKVSNGHVILACLRPNKSNNLCVPVHFHASTLNVPSPNDADKDCNK